MILADGGATAGVDVRGAAPGTRETDLLAPCNLVDKVHAIMLSGGSAFGLDAVSGAMRYLEENGIGVDVGVARVPIVPAAVPVRSGLRLIPQIRPDAAGGYQACLAASARSAGGRQRRRRRRRHRRQAVRLAARDEGRPRQRLARRSTA